MSGRCPLCLILPVGQEKKYSAEQYHGCRQNLPHRNPPKREVTKINIRHANKLYTESHYAVAEEKHRGNGHVGSLPERKKPQDNKQDQALEQRLVQL